MASTRPLIQGFGPEAHPSAAPLTFDHWLIIGPIAAALAMAGVLIWLAG